MPGSFSSVHPLLTLQQFLFCEKNLRVAGELMCGLMSSGGLVAHLGCFVHPDMMNDDRIHI